MNDHLIVAGFGNVGKEACLNLLHEKVDFVVIENDFDRVQSALKENYLAILGDATDEKVLEKANIAKAKGLLTSMSDTSINVYVTLTAREMNKNVNIIARGTGERSEKILYRAGADKVISPAQIGARRMVMTICHNASLDLITSLVRDKNLNVRFVEAIIKDGSPIVGKSLQESEIRKITGGIMVIGVKPIDSEIVLNPAGTQIISKDDKLILLGTLGQIENFRKLVNIVPKEINFVNQS
jgi:voltage-gated potassium channel